MVYGCNPALRLFCFCVVQTRQTALKCIVMEEYKAPSFEFIAAGASGPLAASSLENPSYGGEWNWGTSDLSNSNNSDLR